MSPRLLHCFLHRASVLVGCAALLVGCASHRQPKLTQAELDAQEMSPAELEFQSGISRAPTPRTLYALAQILTAQGKESEAQFLLRRVINEHPDFMPAYCALAEAQLRQRHIEEAINTLSTALKFSPKEAVLINDRGMCRMLLRDFKGAQKDFMLATGLAPDNARYRANMAASLGMQGRYDESLALYKQVMSPEDARHNLAVLCDARGDREQADVLRGKAPVSVTPAPAPVVPAPVASVEVVIPLMTESVEVDAAQEAVAAEGKAQPATAVMAMVVADEQIEVESASDLGELPEFQADDSASAADIQDVMVAQDQKQDADASETSGNPSNENLLQVEAELVPAGSAESIDSVPGTLQPEETIAD